MNRKYFCQTLITERKGRNWEKDGEKNIILFSLFIIIIIILTFTFSLSLLHARNFFPFFCCLCIRHPQWTSRIRKKKNVALKNYWICTRCCRQNKLPWASLKHCLFTTLYDLKEKTAKKKKMKKNKKIQKKKKIKVKSDSAREKSTRMPLLQHAKNTRALSPGSR